MFFRVWPHGISRSKADPATGFVTFLLKRRETQFRGSHWPLSARQHANRSASNRLLISVKYGNCGIPF